MADKGCATGRTSVTGAGFSPCASLKLAAGLEIQSEIEMGLRNSSAVMAAAPSTKTRAMVAMMRTAFRSPVHLVKMRPDGLCNPSGRTIDRPRNGGHPVVRPDTPAANDYFSASPVEGFSSSFGALPLPVKSNSGRIEPVLMSNEPPPRSCPFSQLYSMNFTIEAWLIWVRL